MNTKDLILTNLTETESILFQHRLFKNWRAGKLTTSKLSPMEIKLIKEYCLTDINWYE